MPTFDFGNVIKSLLGVSLKSIVSPVVYIPLSVALIATGISTFTDWFDALSIPSLSIDFEIPDSDLVNLIFYCTASDKAIEIVDFVISSLVIILNIFIKFGVVAISLSVLVGSYRLVRQAIKDSIGQ